MRKFFLVTTACVLCAPFAIASAQEVSGEVTATAGQDLMAAELNSQQLAQFRAGGEGYEGEGDIAVDADAVLDTEDSVLETEAEPVLDTDAGVTGEGDIDVEVEEDNVPDGVEEAADETAEAIDEQADDAEDAARDEADALRDSADEAGDDLSHDAEEAVEEAADEAADEIEENAEAAEEAADETAEDVEDSANELRDDITDDPLVDDESDLDMSTPPYDRPDEADAIKDPTDPN